MIPNQRHPGSPTAPSARPDARLTQLLELRDLLGALGAERRSHRLSDAWQVAHELHMVEEEIRERSPAAHAEGFPVWVRRDEQRRHAADALEADCGICQAIAVGAGVNLRQPDAA